MLSACNYGACSQSSSPPFMPLHLWLQFRAFPFDNQYLIIQCEYANRWACGSGVRRRGGRCAADALCPGKGQMGPSGTFPPDEQHHFAQWWVQIGIVGAHCMSGRR